MLKRQKYVIFDISLWKDSTCNWKLKKIGIKKIKLYTKQYIHAYTKYSENMKYSKAKIRILTVVQMEIWIYWSESNSRIYFYIFLNKN